MKYKIKYREYDERCLIEGVSVIEAQAFAFENRFVGILTNQSETPTPDLYINVDDVLSIERVD